MKLNASKTKTMTVFRSRTVYQNCFKLTIGGTVLKKSDGLVILGVTFYSKMIFEKLRSVSRAASQMLGIFRSREKYSMIDCFLGDAFTVLSCQFWSPGVLCPARF